MPEEYGVLKRKVPKEKGEAPNGPQAFKDYDDSVTKPAGASTGQFLIVQNTGAIAYKAMKGDATLAEDGTLTIANLAVVAAKLAAEAVETGKIKNLAVTAAKLAALAVETGKIAEGAVTDAKVAAANKDGTAATPSMRTLGTGAQQAAAGNDTRLWGAQTGEPTTTGGVPAASKYLPVNIGGVPYKILLGV